LWVT